MQLIDYFPLFDTADFAMTAAILIGWFVSTVVLWFGK